jgi:predicted TPR repeat methyltransferase
VAGPGADALIARVRAAEGTLSPGYVRALFDGYAGRFDGDLTGRLRYAVPELIEAALPGLLGVPAGRLDIIDLGCGTGLAGVALRPYARRLHGVDLSPRMLDRARARGIYDDLEAADLATALRAGGAAAWDLAVAADVLVYVGDLTPVFAAAAAALRPGGLLIASAEQAPDGDGAGDGVVLLPTRRYAHGAGHIRAAAAAAGLSVTALDPVTPRWESRQPLPGWLFVLKA